MKEIVINRENFEKEVLKSDVPVLLDFWAPWCGPCRMLAPSLSDITERYDGRVRVGKVNVDEEPELAEAFRVEGIPALFLVRDGRVVKSSVGLRPAREIEAMINA